MKRALAALGFGALVLAGCGNGEDGLSQVIGPNPVSDIREVVERLHDEGWSDEHVAGLQGYLSGLGIEDEDAACLVSEFADRFSPDEFGASTGDEPEVAEALDACGYELTSGEATGDEPVTPTTFGQGWTDSDLEEALGGLANNIDDEDVAACFVAYVAERYSPSELEDLSARDLLDLQDAVQAECQP